MADKNLILLIVDGLTFRRFDPLGKQAAVCPTLASMMRSGTWCEKFFAHGNPTEFAMPSLFSSSLPLDFGGYQHGVRYRPVTLMEHLKQCGYATSIVSESYILDGLYGFDRGVDEIFGMYDIELIWRIMRRSFLWHILRDRKSLGEESFLRAVHDVVDRFYRFIIEYARRWHAMLPRYDLTRSRFLDYDFARIGRLMESELAKLEAAPERYLTANLDAFMTVTMEQFLGIEPVRRAVMRRLKPYEGRRVPGTNLTFRAYDKQATADEAFNAARQWIAGVSGRPFATVVHLVDLHDLVYSSGEYFMAPPKDMPLQSGADPDDWEDIRHHYSLRFVDNAIAAFLARLPATVRDNTVFVVTSDHGANKFRSEAALSSRSGSGSFHDEYLHIPFIIQGPGVPAGARTGLQSSIDLAPTVCQALGIQRPSEFKGRSIFDPDPGASCIMAEHTHRGPCDPLGKPVYLCLRSTDHKYIYKERRSEHDHSLPDTEILFDLSNDPDECRNMADDPEFKDVLARFRALARARLESIKAQALPNSGARRADDAEDRMAAAAEGKAP